MGLKNSKPAAARRRVSGCACGLGRRKASSPKQMAAPPPAGVAPLAATPQRVDLVRMDSWGSEAGKQVGLDACGGQSPGALSAPAKAATARPAPLSSDRPAVPHRNGGGPAAAEAERLEEVQSSLDVLPKTKSGLDSITALCSQLYSVPLSGINLLDKSRLVFASASGPLAEGWGDGIDRAGTFCEALLLPQVHTLLCVPDTTADPRFSRLACVAEEPGVRFYAGTPLISSKGHRLGSLCLFDLQPRRLSPDALNLLACLSEMAARLLEEHKVEELQRQQRQITQAAAGTAAAAASVPAQPGTTTGTTTAATAPHSASHHQFQAGSQLERDPATLRHAVLLCDTSTRRWTVLWCNQASAQLTGLPESQLQGSCLFEVFVPQQGPSAPPAAQEAARHGRSFAVRLALPGGGRWAEVQFSPASQQELEGAATHPLVDVSPALRAAGAPSGADISPSLYFAFIQRGVREGGH